MSLAGFRSLLAVLSTGFESRGMVMGAGAYQVYQPVNCGAMVGPAVGGWVGYSNYEHALRLAWWDVIARIEDEARRVEAHGVVGTYLIEKRPTAGTSTMELQLVGTAVRVPGVPLLPRPFLSMLAMDDTMRLLLRGWVASGIVVGVAALHVHQWQASAFTQGVAFKNAEMDAPTAGLRQARAQAEADARAALARAGGSGMVGASLELRRVPQTGGEGLLIESRLLGTGVVRFGDAVVPVGGVRNLAKGRT